MIALIPGKWLAVYIDARAMLSSQRSKVWPRRWLDFWLVGCFGALADAGHGFHRFHWVLPAALSAESITASV